MNDTRTELKRAEEQFPTHQEIETLAYDVYLKRGCEQGHAVEHWLAAEEHLLWQRGQGRAAHPKATTITVGPDGTAAIAPERDIAIADEELAQVRASEKIKEERVRAVPPRARAVSRAHH